MRHERMEIMREENGSPPKEKKKLSSRILRERLGAVPRKPMELSRKHAKVKKQIKQALQDGLGTVPEVSEAIHVPTGEVLWHLMSMKKYGEVIEGAERDNYMEYVLKPVEEEAS